MLSSLQQSIDLIQKSKSILIPLPENINGDALGSTLALNFALQKLGKKVEIVGYGQIPEKLKFLPGIDAIKDKLSVFRDFIISIDTSQNKISRLRYENDIKTLKIFLTTPQKIEQKDIRLEPGPFDYDLIVALDVPDLEALGKIHEQNTELFFVKPIINIDHKAANENFGEVNLVETTASSCAEIAAQIIEALSPNLAEPAIATNLLTGLIHKTHSFQTPNTTPKTLNLASLLVSRGAEQEKIIQHLYKTKPFGSLKLWGRLLGRADYDQGKKTLWLAADPTDFAETETTSKDLLFAMEEIDDAFPEIHTVFIFWPAQEGAVEVLAQTKRPEILQRFCAEFGGEIKGSRARLTLNQTDGKTAKSHFKDLLNSFG